MTISSNNYYIKSHKITVSSVTSGSCCCYQPSVLFFLFVSGGGIIISVPTQSPKSIQRPVSLESSPFSQRALLEGGKEAFSAAMRSGFDALLREWQSSADMLYSIHPIDGSFLLWLVEWVDENIPGVHRQPLVSFSCRIPQAFPQFDATSLCSDLILYRSNLTLDHRVLERGRGVESPTDLKAMTPSYSFVQKLSQVPEGVDIFAYTPKVSMLSKHSNGTLNQWEISFAEGSKFQAVLNVSHVNRSAGHRFQVNDLACHPILPLLLTSSHHNVPRVEVDPDIATSRTRKSSVAARRASLAAKRGSVREPTGSFSLFGKNFLSRSEHARLTKLYETNLESTAKDLPEKDEIVVPDEIMDKLNSEMNWPDMSAPTGLCSELILWKVFHVGPLCKLGGVVELARINSPFISSFSHVSWLPSLLPSSCLPLQSNSPSACFVASDGYSLRLFQAVIDARSLLNEISPTSNQFEVRFQIFIKRFLEIFMNFINYIKLFSFQSVHASLGCNILEFPKLLFFLLLYLMITFVKLNVFFVCSFKFFCHLIVRVYLL